MISFKEKAKITKMSEQAKQTTPLPGEASPKDAYLKARQAAKKISRNIKKS